MVDEGECGIKRQGERGLKDEKRRGGRRTSRSCRRRWRLLCTGRCSVSTRNRTGEEGEDTQRADGAKEEKKRKDRRREGRGETGGLVAATLRYDSRLSYPPHYLVLLPSLPPPFLPMLLLVPVSTPPSLRTNPSSPANVVFRLSPPTLVRPQQPPVQTARTQTRPTSHTDVCSRAQLSRATLLLCLYAASLSLTPHRSLLLALGLFLLPRCLSLSHFFSPCIKPRPHAQARHAFGSLASDKAIAAIVTVAVVTGDVVGASMPMRLCAIATRGLIWYVHAV